MYDLLFVKKLIIMCDFVQRGRIGASCARLGAGLTLYLDQRILYLVRAPRAGPVEDRDVQPLSCTSDTAGHPVLWNRAGQCDDAQDPSGR